MTNINWIFFDVGSTLIDEKECYNHRIKDAIEGTDITFEQFNKKRIFFAKQNLKGDIEALKFFGLTKTPWHFEDEKLTILEAAHYRKIDLSDGIYVVNIDGYIGNSVRKEIEYAKKHNKEVIYHI